MGQKKKNNPALATAHKSKSSRSKSRSASRKTPAKKAKTVETALAVLNPDKLKELYATMVKCRMLAEHMGASEAESKQASAVSGLEATLVGAGAHLQPQDCIALEHSGCLASLIKGTPLRAILSRAHEGQPANGAQPGPPSANNASPAMTHSMATGLALAQTMKSKGSVTLMFATHDSARTVFEPDAMTLAATQKLPIVCLVESRFDSSAETHVLPIPSDSHGVGTGYYPKITVDGGDVVAVFRVAQEAIRRARQGHGPALIECMTSRANGLASGTARHIAHDPLPFMEQYLRRRKLWSDSWSRQLTAGFAKELKTAFASLHEQPGLDAGFDHVYSAENRKAERPVKMPRPQSSVAPAP
jgi:TPP-dependent pyruvate/acetoin dehydrogenase alpha subunit